MFVLKDEINKHTGRILLILMSLYVTATSDLMITITYTSLNIN